MPAGEARLDQALLARRAGFSADYTGLQERSAAAEHGNPIELSREGIDAIHVPHELFLWIVLGFHGHAGSHRPDGQKRDVQRPIGIIRVHNDDRFSREIRGSEANLLSGLAEESGLDRELTQRIGSIRRS